MTILGLLGVAAFGLVSAVVGIRLLALARRTRQAPELAMGLAFVLSGAIAFPLLTAAGFLFAMESPTLARLSASVGTTTLFAGYVALALGAWRIYRPATRWPLVPIAAGTAVLVAASLVSFLSTDSGPGGLRDVSFWTGASLGSLTFGWNAFESFSLHRQLRKRLALGLAEPEVTNRVLMWGVGSCAACLMTLHGLAARLLVGQVLDDGYRLVSSGLGLIAAIAIALAFFPPAAYRRRFTAPATRGGSL